MFATCSKTRPEKAWHYEMLLWDLICFEMALIQISLFEKIRKRYQWRRYALKTERKSPQKVSEPSNNHEVNECFNPNNLPTIMTTHQKT